MESNGKASEKHGEKLGKFFKFGNSKNNRFSYRHENGDSYLYWQKGVWMVSFEIKYPDQRMRRFHWKDSQIAKFKFLSISC